VIPRRVAPLLAACIALGACATFETDAARVEDASLSREQFDELARIAVGQPEIERVDIPLDVAADILNTWIVAEVVEADLRAAGVDPVAAEETSGDPLNELVARQQALLQQWDGLEASSDAEFRAAYERGPTSSEVVCSAHILLASEADARAVVDELDAGADFAELAAERSTDPASAASGGALPCTTLPQFEAQYVPEFVDAALGAQLGVPTDPVRSPFGIHVILLRPWDDIADDPAARTAFDDLGVRFRRSVRAAEVHVDPRFGAFTAEQGVVRLG